MPDTFLMARAALTAAVIAAAILLAVAWRSFSPWRRRLGWSLGVSVGFVMGCGTLGLWPMWPPTADRDRWLCLLLPATLMIDCAGSTSLPAWLKWLLRSCLATAVLPILLHNTVYLTDLGGPGSREWPVPTTFLIVIGLGLMLLVLWLALERLQLRSSEETVGAILFMACAASGIAVMSTGYLTAGEMGVVLAGAHTGVTASSILLASKPKDGYCPGAGVVGLFSVIILGRFMGSLPTSFGVCLLLAPLAAWIPECFPGTGVRVRALVRLAAVAMPLAVVVWATWP